MGARTERRQVVRGRLHDLLGLARRRELPAGREEAAQSSPGSRDLERIYAHVPDSRSARILVRRMMLGMYDIRNNRGVGHPECRGRPEHDGRNGSAV